MTPKTQAIRFLGNIVMLVAAWYHALDFLVLSFGLIGAAWFYGLLVPPEVSRDPPTDPPRV